MKKIKIYRIEVCASNDSCTEFWSRYPVSDFYSNKEKAEREWERLKKLTREELEDLADVLYIGDNKPYLEEYDLIED